MVGVQSRVAAKPVVPAPLGERPSLRDELRATTGPLHARLEDRIAGEGWFASRERCRAFLACFHACHRPLELRLRRFAWAGLLPDADARLVKTGWLERDLERLGAPVQAAPVRFPVPAPADLDEALGCLYVIEGATLGGVLIERSLAADLGLSPEHGLRFFHGYGEARGRMWRVFLDALAARELSPAGRARLIAAACATFAAFEACLRMEALPR